jgi:hypothetical protein
MIFRKFFLWPEELKDCRLRSLGAVFVVIYLLIRPSIGLFNGALIDQYDALTTVIRDF